jgi:DNA-binding NtrC family response regulator
MNPLIVNHHGSLRRLVGQLASQTGWLVKIANLMPDFRKMIPEEKIDLLVCDATPAQEVQESVTRLEFIQTLRDAKVTTPVFLFEEEGEEITLEPDLTQKAGWNHGISKTDWISGHAEGSR